MIYKIPLNYIFALIKWIANILLWFAINLAVELLWAGIELQRYGVTKPSYEDAVIGIILTFSLYTNISKSLTYQSIRLDYEIWATRMYREGMKKANDKMEESVMKLKRLAEIASEMGVQAEICKLTCGQTGIFIPLERIVDGKAHVIPLDESAPLMKYLNHTKTKWNYYGNYSGITVIIPAGFGKG